MAGTIDIGRLAPGHDSPPMAGEAIPGLLSGFHVSEGGVATPIAELTALDRHPGGWYWLHFNLADMRARNWLAQAAIVPKTGLDLLLSGDDTQELVATDDCLKGIFFDLAYAFGGKTDEFGHLRFVMTDRFLVSGRRQALNSVETVRQEIAGGRRFPAAADLLRAIVDQVVSGINRIVDDLAAEIDAIEDLILKNRYHDERQRLGRVRLTTVRIHRRLNGLRSLFRRLADDESSIAERLRASVGQLVQRFDEIDHEVVELRDRARLLQDEITIKLAEQTNRHLHVLSIVTTLLLPPSLVASLFGMNVSGLPFAAGSAGFWLAFGVAFAASAIAAWVLAAIGVFKGRRDG